MHPMIPERLEELRHEYTDQLVVVESGRPECARFEGKTGRVVTLNANGRALVQFEGEDRARYDIELDFLKVLDTPAPAETEQNPIVSESPPSQPPVPVQEEKEAELSELERARLNRST
jgi:hypothetical protein